MTTRRTPLLLALFLGLVGVLAACGGVGTVTEDPVPEPIYAVNVTAQDWSGWSQPHDPQPEPTMTQVLAWPGATVQVEAVSGPVTFTVTTIRDDLVVVTSDAPFAPRSSTGSGWAMDEPVQRWGLRDGESVRVVTPTLDAGTEITLTVEHRFASGGGR